MIMLRDSARRLPQWDASAKLSLALAVALLILLVALGFGGPREIQMPARIGAFGLLVTLQLLFLWANRRNISPYHQAQTHFVAGEYQAARSLLEDIPESSRVSVDALVLLGNCYRHLGLYKQSAAALGQALEIKPRHHLALFSQGKLKLVLGEYASAADMIQKALAAGAPEIVRFELGQACFHAGDVDAATTQFKSALANNRDDPPLALLGFYYLYRMGAGEICGQELTGPSIDHWREEASKHRSTPYGEAMRLVVSELDKLLARSRGVPASAPNANS